jgi:hypothetical protein
MYKQHQHLECVVEEELQGTPRWLARSTGRAATEKTHKTWEFQNFM